MALKPRTAQLLIEAMAKHLPPSGSTLRLWDVGGRVGEFLHALRPDLHIEPILTPYQTWQAPTEALDSIMGLDFPHALEDDFLTTALQMLRPGGRLILVDSQAEPTRDQVTALESSGHTRILVEDAIECPLPLGVLMRGEKPHTTESTFRRVRVASDVDPDNLPLTDYDGVFIYLLVRQLPNKPAWALNEFDVITWDAVTAARDSQPMVLAFTSLPKAVSFMQPAVMQNLVDGVNKVGKFNRDAASAWGVPLWLNPPLTDVKAWPVGFFSVDPTTAERADE